MKCNISKKKVLENKKARGWDKAWRTVISLAQAQNYKWLVMHGPRNISDWWYVGPGFSVIGCARAQGSQWLCAGSGFSVICLAWAQSYKWLVVHGPSNISDWWYAGPGFSVIGCVQPQGSQWFVLRRPRVISDWLCTGPGISMIGHVWVQGYQWLVMGGTMVISDWSQVQVQHYTESQANQLSELT